MNPKHYKLFLVVPFFIALFVFFMNFVIMFFQIKDYNPFFSISIFSIPILFTIYLSVADKEFDGSHMGLFGLIYSKTIKYLKKRRLNKLAFYDKIQEKE